MSLSSCHHGPKPETNNHVRIWNHRGRLYLHIHMYMYCIQQCRSWVDRMRKAKRNNISLWEKESRHRPWVFFLVLCCISNMLGRFQNVNSLWDSTPQNGASKLSPPHIFATGVQLRVFTSSCLAQLVKKPSCPLPSALCRTEEHPCPLVPLMRTRFRGTQLSPVFVN